jgi:hypothetical protein
MKNFIAIEKYGCFYDPFTEETCPMNVDGTPDNDEMAITHILDIECDEEEEILFEIKQVMRRLKAIQTIREI